MRSNEEILKERGAEPNYWINRATDLYAAAGAVWHCMQTEQRDEVTESIGLPSGFNMFIATGPVYRMLCGMALEIGLKGVIVGQGKEPRRSHDLVVLAEDAGIQMTHQQQGLFALLRESVVWEGRYPVPKTERELEYQTFLHFETLYRKVDGKGVTIMRPLEPNPLDWPGFQELWRVVSSHFTWPGHG